MARKVTPLEAIREFFKDAPTPLTNAELMAFRSEPGGLRKFGGECAAALGLELSE